MAKHVIGKHELPAFTVESPADRPGWVRVSTEPLDRLLVFIEDGGYERDGQWVRCDVHTVSLARSVLGHGLDAEENAIVFAKAEGSRRALEDECPSPPPS